MMERRSVVFGGALSFAEQLQAFSALATPGMTLLAPNPEPPEPPKPPAPQPLVSRCHCGQRISGNKPCCRACGMAALAKTAAALTSQEELDQFLKRFTPAERDEALALMEPHLTFTRLEPATLPCPGLADK